MIGHFRNFPLWKFPASYMVCVRMYMFELQYHSNATSHLLKIFVESRGLVESQVHVKHTSLDEWLIGVETEATILVLT